MANGVTQDEVFRSIVQSVIAGAGDTKAGTQVERLLHRLYFQWIVKPGRDTDKSPLDVWNETDGEKLRARFVDIGRLASGKAAIKISAREGLAELKQAATFEHDDVVMSAFEVETNPENKCPWCEP